MKKLDSNLNDLELENLFNAARATPPPVPPGLMARAIADAHVLQRGGKGTGWRSWILAIGGLPALGGLVTATCVGFWFGVAPPEGVPDLAGQVLGQQISIELDNAEMDIAADLNGFGWDIEEGYADG